MSAVRRATPADLPALRAIQTAALVEPWPDLLAPATESGATLVLEDSDTVVGYAVAVGAEGGPAYVPELAVAPAHQGTGHGSTLLAGLLDRLAAAGHTSVRVTVLADDDRAVGFYRANGFRVLERRPDEFDAGPGLLLERDLSRADGEGD